MTKFDTQGIEVGLGYVEDCVPGVKALIEEVLEILRDPQLRKYVFQFSHTAGSFVWIQPSRNSSYHEPILSFERARNKSDSLKGQLTTFKGYY